MVLLGAGTAALALRGGSSGYNAHGAALISIASNTLAITMLASAEKWLINHRGARRHGRMWRLEDLLLDALLAFAVYYCVFQLSGFVPMGHVAGSSPLLPRLLGH